MTIKNGRREKKVYQVIRATGSGYQGSRRTGGIANNREGESKIKM